jgi:hypothetical protein
LLVQGVRPIFVALLDGGIVPLVLGILEIADSRINYRNAVIARNQAWNVIPVEDLACSGAHRNTLLIEAFDKFELVVWEVVLAELHTIFYFVLHVAGE